MHAPAVGFMFERKEHLAFGAVVLAWAGASTRTCGAPSKPRQRQRLRTIAFRAYCASAAPRCSSRLLGTIVASIEASERACACSPCVSPAHAVCGGATSRQGDHRRTSGDSSGIARCERWRARCIHSLRTSRKGTARMIRLRNACSSSSARASSLHAGTVHADEKAGRPAHAFQRATFPRRR